MDTLTDAKLRCVHDHSGNLLLGKVPTPGTDCAILSADFICFATIMGNKEKRK